MSPTARAAALIALVAQRKERTLIEAAGCTLLYLPPYSPDLSPIEPAWSTLNALLRGLGAQT
jgi:transposase